MATHPHKADTDGDLFGDSSEVAAGTDPTIVDRDGDAFPDGAEITNATDPNNAASHP